MSRRLYLLLAAAIVAAVATLAAIKWWHRRPSLPYQDAFAKNQAAEWTPYAGQWQMQNGELVNRSDEDGAKVVTGSPLWTDYELDTDLKLIGQHGNAGVIVRVSDEELGADSYSGYYVGLRVRDSALVAGRADHGWVGGSPVLVRGGVTPGVWYHLRVIVVGCMLTGEVTNLESGESSTIALEENNCVRSGKIGLRSIGTGGAWRHVRVVPATQAQLRELMTDAPFVTHPLFPDREDEYNRMMDQLAASAQKLSPFSTSAIPEPGTEKLMNIDSGKTMASPTEDVVFRGVVTLTSPVYIQDETSGIEVRALPGTDLNLGDEVQVRGRVVPGAVSAYLRASSLQVVGEHTTVPPVAVTSAQASDGSFDGRLVALSGTLLSKSSTDDVVRLQMADGEERFQAVVRGLLAPGQLQQWVPGSRMRVIGICSVGPSREDGDGAFTILLRSMDDAEVLRGPPWWAPQLIARYILALLVAVALGVYVYLRIQRHKMEAILEERERLAHEMHDTLAQSFAGVGFHLQGVRNRLRAGSMPLPEVIEKLDWACKMVTHTHREASAEIAALQPRTDAGLDILTALESATRAMVDEECPQLTLHRQGSPRTMSLALRDSLFQVGRESIANVLRHSQATEITLRIFYEARRLTLEIGDNGCGFEVEKRGDDFGIRGMKRRMERVGGVLDITTKPGGGTVVTARAPYGLRFHAAHFRAKRSAKPHRSI